MGGRLQKKTELGVLAVDDHPTVLDSIRMVLRSSKSFTLIDTAADGREAIDKAYDLKPRVIVMDENMPRCSGVRATAEIRRFAPNVRIIFYSGFPRVTESAMAAGANAFFGKDTPATDLLLAMQVVLNGGVYLDEILWRSLRQRWPLSVAQPDDPHFDAEEQAVSELLTLGLTTKEIALRLQKNPRRIDKIRAHLMAKTGTKNVASLVLKIAGFAAVNQTMRMPRFQG